MRTGTNQVRAGSGRAKRCGSERVNDLQIRSLVQVESAQLRLGVTKEAMQVMHFGQRLERELPRVLSPPS